MLADAEVIRAEGVAKANQIIASIIAFITIAVGAFGGIPVYNVWSAQKHGEAELARAEQNRQIVIQEAKAKQESAIMLADAEVIRAEGVAKANQIIGDSLKGNEAYIHWLWVDTLKDTKDQIIYIPTEAGVPLMESQRLQLPKGK